MEGRYRRERDPVVGAGIGMGTLAIGALLYEAGSSTLGGVIALGGAGYALWNAGRLGRSIAAQGSHRPSPPQGYEVVSFTSRMPQPPEPTYDDYAQLHQEALKIIGYDELGGEDPGFI